MLVAGVIRAQEGLYDLNGLGFLYSGAISGVICALFM